MIDCKAAKLLLQNGFYVTDIPILKGHLLEKGFRDFLIQEERYKLDFLQKKYGYAFDGYSFLGQEDSSNQAYNDLVHTFVVSDFHQPDKFPKEFAAFFEQEWDECLGLVSEVEREIIQQLELKGLAELYKEKLGHMVSCNYYPPIKGFESYAVENTRLSAHNDISLFTVFPFGLAAGFEFENAEGEWIQVPPCDTVLIFPDFMLEYWTQGKLKSLNHRVSLPQSRSSDRVSFAFFSLPKPEQSFGLCEGEGACTSEVYFEKYLGQFD
ncbi:2OG-Fe(II) oxygenase family protein [Flammeovirgaceae bacterium SG7u.111]|nr:2OG-Fe(II) oxygenase family protein [Flammeovirgaceae bacterium SG7u.132]WPO33441.1 2OG-Fe(II) oxygenase family protein [Flammeovirgaceae bacterium SG7u.111]